MKLSDRNGQHTLEYMILLTLIMAGIIIGGPYVIRSWNAQMKGWEDSVIDSMTDPLAQAPPNIVPITGCDWVSWGSCGLGDCCGLGYSLFGSSISCTPQQLLQRGVFNPLNCELSDSSTSPSLIARCDTNDANHCCTDWRAVTSGCTVTCPGCPGASCPTQADCGVNAVSITGVRADGLPGCEDGAYGRSHICDTGYTETECVPDPGCYFTCINPLPGLDETTSPPTLSNATFCAGDNAGLLGDTNYVIMSACTPAKCEFVCNPTFVYNGSACVCPAGQTVVNGVCTCTSTVSSTWNVGTDSCVSFQYRTVSTDAGENCYTTGSSGDWGYGEITNPQKTCGSSWVYLIDGSCNDSSGGGQTVWGACERYQCCPVNTVWDSGTGSCVCAPGTTLVSGSCVVISGQVVYGGPLAADACACTCIAWENPDQATCIEWQKSITGWGRTGGDVRWLYTAGCPPGSVEQGPINITFSDCFFSVNPAGYYCTATAWANCACP